MRLKRRRSRKDLTLSWHLVGICTASVKVLDSVSLVFSATHNTIPVCEYYLKITKLLIICLGPDFSNRWSG